MANPYEIISIEENAWRIEEGGVRAFLFAGAGEALVVDTGFGGGNLREAVQNVTTLPLRLVNTHTDRDHIGGNGQFDKAWMHPAEYDRYAQGGALCPAAPLWEGDVIDIGTWRFEVILIPGHTPGSIALLEARRRILLAGDSVQAGAVYLFGAGRNLPAFIESMEKLRDIRGRFGVIYPSHGDFPVPADILDDVVDGARALQQGELTAAEPPYDIPAKLFGAARARFFY